MLLSMLKVEHTKLYRRKAIWIELAVVASLIVALFGVVFVAFQSGEVPASELGIIGTLLTWPNGINLSLAVASNQILGALLTIVLVSMIVAQEYTWQTYSLAIRAGVSRRTVLTAKFVTLAGAAFLMVVTALLVGTLMSGLFTAFLNGHADFSHLNVADVLFGTLTTAYALLPYMALTFLIAVFTRSLPASIGIGAGYAFLVEGILPPILMLLGGLPAQIALHMPGQLASALSNVNGQTTAIQMGSDAGVSASQVADPTAAVVGIALYTLVFLGLAFLKFQKQDLTA